MKRTASGYQRQQAKRLARDRRRNRNRQRAWLSAKRRAEALRDREKAKAELRRQANIRHEARLARLGLAIFLGFVAFALCMALGGCGPSNVEDTSAQFDQEYLAVPRVWVRMESSLTAQQKAWAEDSIRAHDGHYWTWHSRFGTHRLTRSLTVYVHDEARLVSPQRVNVLAFTVEDNLSTFARDEIHTVLGHKGTLPHLMRCLHQASLWPRDYFYQDPLNGWDVIFGSMTAPPAGSGIVAGPAPVVNVTAGQATWSKGLEQQVVERLEMRR